MLVADRIGLGSEQRVDDEGAAVASVRFAALCPATLPASISRSSSRRERSELLSLRVRHSSKSGCATCQFSVSLA